MSTRARLSRERRLDQPTGIDPTTPDQRQAATAVVLAQLEEGKLTHEGAYETLSMLGLLAEAESL